MKRLLPLLILAMLACNAPTVAPTAAPTSPQPTADARPTPTPISTEEPVEGRYGPDGFPADINPLTGLPVTDEAVLQRRPLLVKVSNESDAVRPQSGLSYADHVWEYVMEDLRGTRFTAVFLSQTPEQVGSVRSARLIDTEHLIEMYGGLFVTSGGSSNLADPPGSPARIRELLLAAPYSQRVLSNQTGAGSPYMERIPGVPRQGTAYYHSLFAIPAAVWAWAEEEGFDQQPDLSGLLFDPRPPEGGTPTAAAIVDYPDYGPRRTWAYDEDSGRWLSSTGGMPDTDYLREGEQLAFENVVILSVRHYTSDFLEDDNARLFSLGQDLNGDGEAVLLRDGQRYDVRWRREASGLLFFIDGSGARIALKPGTTWFMTNVANTTDYRAAEVSFE